MTASPQRLGYRNRVTFTLRRLRGGRVVAGFHALDRPAHVVDVSGACLLAEEPIIEAWRDLRAGWGSRARLLPDAGRLSLTLRNTSDGVILVVSGGGDWDAGPLAEAVPSLRAIWHRSGRDRPAICVSGDPVVDTWGDDGFTVSGQAFVQVNRSAAQALVDHVLEVAGRTATAVDAYCGVGVYGRALAREGVDVTGIELDPAARTVASHDAPEGFQVLQGSVETLLPDVLPTELVLLNPPRSGVHEDVAATLMASDVRHIVYVSCDPATLARDLSLLAPRYRVESIQAFDLFPQTAHVETVVSLQRTEDA